MLDQPAADHIAAEMNSMALDFLEPSAKPGSLGRLGHYEVLEVVGQGGMGVVLRAFDDKLHRVVAIKVLAPALASNGTARQRFVREARAAAAVTHDNVIDIHAVEDTGPVPYLVMQFIDGCTLQQKLDRSGPLPVKEILRIGLQIAEGLAAAHQQGLIHRDIKPANILLENGIERVKITDFGLARAVDDASLTQSGYIAGTPAYMSPEQANGETRRSPQRPVQPGQCAVRDVRRPSAVPGDTTLAVLKRVCDETPRPLREINPDLPEWLEALVARLHAKNPADRFASASEVAKVLGRRLAQFQSDGVFGDIGSAEVTPVRSKKSPAKNRAQRRKRCRRRGRRGGRIDRELVRVSVMVCKDARGEHGDPVGANARDSERSRRLETEPTSALAARRQRANRGVLPRRQDHGLRRQRPKHLPLGHENLGSAAHSEVILAKCPASRSTRTGLVWHPSRVRRMSALFASGTWRPASRRRSLRRSGMGNGMWDVAYSPDGKTLACGGSDKTLHIIDVATGAERFAISGVVDHHLRTLSFSSDGQQIATGGRGPTSLWDTKTREKIPTTRLELRRDFCPTILPDGKGLVGWSYSEGRVTICDLPSGQVRWTRIAAQGFDRGTRRLGRRPLHRHHRQ